MNILVTTQKQCHERVNVTLVTKHQIASHHHYQIHEMDTVVAEVLVIHIQILQMVLTSIFTMLVNLYGLDIQMSW